MGRCPNRLKPCKYCGEAMGLRKMQQHVAMECTAKEMTKQRKLIDNARRRLLDRVGTADNLVQFWQTKLFDNGNGMNEPESDDEGDEANEVSNENKTETKSEA